MPGDSLRPGQAELHVRSLVFKKAVPFSVIRVSPCSTADYDDSALMALPGRPAIIGPLTSIIQPTTVSAWTGIR